MVGRDVDGCSIDRLRGSLCLSDAACDSELDDPEASATALSNSKLAPREVPVSRRTGVGKAVLVSVKMTPFIADPRSVRLFDDISRRGVSCWAGGASFKNAGLRECWGCNRCTAAGGKVGRGGTGNVACRRAEVFLRGVSSSSVSLSLEEISTPFVGV